MKKLLLVFLLATPAACWAAPKINPAGYNTTVHVQASRLVLECGSHLGSSFCGPQLRINVVIDGKKFELECKQDSTNLLRIGDYKARIWPPDPETPEYVDAQKYEILFSDGKTLMFRLVGETE